VNDGSSDDTENIALGWTKKDNRFKYIRINHGGPSVSRNAALKEDNGDYIQFLDADDVIDSKKLEIQIASLKDTSEFALSICDYDSTDENLLNPVPARYLSPKFKTSNHIYELISDWENKLSIPIHCFLFKISLFNHRNIFFNETLPNHVDWECWMNIFKQDPDIKYIDLKLATYRIHKKGLCSNPKKMKEGFLMSLTIQMKTFSKNSKEYTLLKKRYNQLKYNSSSGIVPVDIIWGILKGISFSVKKLIPWLINSFLKPAPLRNPINI
jgi:glycosyltransferase involved in cell wall biosynthesis